MGQQELTRAYSSYTYLTTMLDQGWQIESPVYVRPRWRSRTRPRQEDTYHFVLRQGERFSLISVFDCPEVRQFLEDTALDVDRQ
jgi:hypothetical protein